MTNHARLLSDIPIKDTPSVHAALDKLHAMGAKSIIITSVELEDYDSSLLHLFASTPGPNGAFTRFKISFPKFNEFFTGTGDLFASLILGYFDGSKPLPEALLDASEKAISVIQSILEKTLSLSASRFEEYAFMTDEKARKIRSLELCLVQSKSLIENPSRNFKGVLLSSNKN